MLIAIDNTHFNCPLQMPLASEAQQLVRSADIAPNECGYCGKLFICVGTRVRHEHELHENYFRYQCDICGQGAHGKKELVGHMAQHTKDVKGYSKCDDCGLNFQFDRQLEYHKKVRHSD